MNASLFIERLAHSLWNPLALIFPDEQGGTGPIGVCAHGHRLSQPGCFSGRHYPDAVSSKNHIPGFEEQTGPGLAVPEYNGAEPAASAIVLIFPDCHNVRSPP